MSEEKHKTLIIDDDLITQELIKSIAEDQGLDVMVCSDAESGLAYFLSDSPRLIIIDWNLPGMSGLELCRKMRESSIGKYLSILMVSSRSEADDLEKALLGGVNYYMSKPIQASFLKAWLTSAVKNSTNLRELEKSDEKINSYKQELEDVNDQLEYSIGQANQMAQEAEQSYIEINQIFKTVAGGVVLIDNDFNILRHNETYLEMSGSLEDDLVGLKCSEVFYSDLCGSADCPLAQIKNGAEHNTNQICRIGGEGKNVHYRIISTPFRGLIGELQGIVSHITDITQGVEAEEALKKSEQRYRSLSIVDELTGLFNKRQFNKTLQIEMDRAKRYGNDLSLIIMDIDNFKHHNDTYGHAEGDKVLNRLGEIIANCVRSSDHASRYGGEEFSVILPNTVGESATVVAEKIRVALEEEEFFPTPDEKVIKTMSLGVTQYLDGDSRESLIKRADSYLYKAKNQGKNRFILG